MHLTSIIEKSPTIQDVNSDNFTDWFFTKHRSVTFINPVNYVMLAEHPNLINGIDHFFFDGILAKQWLGWLTRNKFCRLSFDFTSIADQFFQYCLDNGKSVYILGGTQSELENFSKIIKKKYPQLCIVGQHHGFYTESQWQSVFVEISALNPDTVICGLGCPKQEKAAEKITSKLKKTSAITCGGFIHQTQFKIQYYPKWINKLGLRMFYRLWREPHTRKRIKYIPIFLVKTFLDNMKHNRGRR